MGSYSSKITTNLEFRLVNTKFEAEQLLHESEKKDFYLEECHDHRPNSKARESLTYRPNSMSNQDYQNALRFLENAKSNLPKRLVTDLQQIHIIQLMPTADDGMPHTRPNNIICFPDITQLFSVTTLNHELWHVHQRIYQDEWLQIFQAIGWKPWKAEIPQKLEDYRRLNPDTIDSPNWVFNDTWVPIPIFQDISRPKVSQVVIYFYHVVDKYHTKKIPPELTYYFAGLPTIAYEHPREIAAYMLSDPKKSESSKGFRDLMKQIGHISV